MCSEIKCLTYIEKKIGLHVELYRVIYTGLYDAKFV